MAKERVEIDLKTDTREATRDLNRVNQKLDATSRKAKKVQQDVRSVQGQGLRTQGQAFRRNVLRTQTTMAGPKGALTSEGFQRGIFKFTDTGFAIEGLAAKFVVVAAAGRIVGGISQGLVHTRDLIRKGVDPLEATLGVAANRTVDTLRAVTNAFGIEQTFVGLGALVSGESAESIKAGIDSALRKVKNAFLPSLEREAENILQKELTQFRERARVELMMSNESMFLSWHLSAADLSDFRSGVDRIQASYLEGQVDKHEKLLRKQQEMSTTGAGH